MQMHKSVRVREIAEFLIEPTNSPHVRVEKEKISLRSDFIGCFTSPQVEAIPQTDNKLNDPNR